MSLPASFDHSQSLVRADGALFDFGNARLSAPSMPISDRFFDRRFANDIGDRPIREVEALSMRPLRSAEGV
jgi:hypothetical protein